MRRDHGSRVEQACGTWPSPLTAGMVARAAVRLGSVLVDAGRIYWLEARPDEGGRQVVVCHTPDGRVADVTPPGSNVRTRVHEYGGGAYRVTGGTTYFVEYADQRIYAVASAGSPRPLTPEGKWRYADFVVDEPRRSLIAVREDHSVPGEEAVTTIVNVPLDGSPSAGDVLVSGYDFYSTPRLSPSGRSLCWLAWRHPQMPWDGTELWVADVERSGAIGNPRLVAGGESESLFQPGWLQDGSLVYVSDRNGWWNLYRFVDGRTDDLCPMEAEFGRPQWLFGVTTWAAIDEGRLLVAVNRSGHWQLATLDLGAQTLEPLATELEPGDSIATTSTHAVVVAGSSTEPDAVVTIDLGTGRVDPLRVSSAPVVDRSYVSVPEAIEFPTDGGATAHAFYYPPQHPDMEPLARERPPLVVISHGGPTSSAHARLSPEMQFWTSRGFAVVDVNYGGSAGFGREYRRRLNGQWGIVDVADCVNAALFLVEQGHADPSRLIIRGRSAGGFTTLAAMAFRPEIFHAGASYYGVSDLELLAKETHKFESRYLDSLVGPYPEERDRYRARSPLAHAGELSCPVIFLQGLEDEVVPPDQSELMAQALRAKGVRTSLVMFPGEQHGFRKAEHIARALEAEHAFYAEIFKFG